jgi:hypothetical protein
MGYTNALNDLKRDAKNSLPTKYQNVQEDDLPNKEFRKVITNGLIYGGTMCYRYKKGDDVITRNNKSITKDMRELLRLNQKYIKTPSQGIENILTNISNMHDQMSSMLSDRDELVIGDPIGKPDDIMYNRSNPNCQIVDIDNTVQNEKVIRIAPNSPVAKKLDALNEYCTNVVKSSRPEICIAKLTKITQNLTNAYAGGLDNKSPADIALKNSIGIQTNRELHDQASEIVREMRTGESTVNDQDKKLFESQKRNIMNQAKLRNDAPLTIDAWNFIDTIKGKNLKTFAKRV